jgi:hypothetical protein
MSAPINKVNQAKITINNPSAFEHLIQYNPDVGPPK